MQLAIDQFWQDAKSRYQLLGGDRTRPILSPPDLFLRGEDFYLALKPFTRFDLAASASPHDTPSSASSKPLPPLDVDRRAENPVQKLTTFVEHFSGRVLISAESLGRRETLMELFSRHDLKPKPCEDYAAFVAAWQLA